MSESIYILILLISASLSTYITIPYLIKIAKIYNLKDNPNLRKQHTVAKANIGGLSFTVAFTLSILLINNINLYSIYNNIIIQNIILLIAAILFFIIGFIDDLIELSPLIRITLQIIISCIIWTKGIGIYAFDTTFISSIQNPLILPPQLSLAISVIWIVGITNSINWMDGLDGLAAGIIFIASITLLIIYFLKDDINNALIAATLASTTFAFLRYNFYPSKILMGDGGSNFLGFIIGTISLVNTSSNQIINNQTTTVTNVFIPLLILFVPIVDMTYVIISRIISLKSPFYPDRRHIHHRFLKLGFSHKQTVICIYLISLIPSMMTISLI